MRSFVLFIFRVLALAIGCKGKENKADYRELRDSLAKLVSQGALHNDSAMMLRALSLSDSLLRIDTTRATNGIAIIIVPWLSVGWGVSRSLWLTAKKHVFVCRKTIQTACCSWPAKSVRERQKDSARFYFAKLFAVCDSTLNKKFDENVAITKMKGIYLRDGKERARAFLAEQVKAHPKNTQLRSMLDDWADIANGFDQEHTMHSKSPSTRP